MKGKTVIITGLTLFAGVLCVFWALVLKPVVVVQRCQGSMRELKHAVLQFTGIHGRLPASMAEIVDSGILPEESDAYFNDVLHGSVIPRRIPYRAIEFDVSFTPEYVLIKMPDEANHVYPPLYRGNSVLEKELRVRKTDIE